ncbi:MAG: tetratricopeptide repeat protein [Acidobacteria bacterium]|nr:tetratricopeptide repeat protein [Acidobacteriota bacterium]
MISTIEIPTIDQALGGEPEEIASHLYDSAVACYGEGRMRQAESLFRRALYLFEKNEGPDHPDVAQVLINLAAIHKDRCEYEAAEEMYQRAVMLMDQTADDGETNIEQMRLGAWCSLGAIYRVRGEYDRAASFLHRALDHAERKFGPESMEVIEALNQLGVLGKCTGRFDEAEGYYHRVLSILQQWLGPDHPGLASLHFTETSL